MRNAGTPMEPKTYAMDVFQECRERIELAYQKALQAELQDPVVLVLDLRVPLAYEMVRRAGAEDALKHHMAVAAACGIVPTAIWHLPGQVAARMFADFPEVAMVLADSPLGEGAFYTAFLVGDGVSLCITPALSSAT